jgi:hypothetical protein
MCWNNSYEANYRGSTREVKEKTQAKRNHKRKHIENR